MNCAYVGIVSRHGLELFCREEEHTVHFLLSRVRRATPSRACCVWFVMDLTYDTVVAGLLNAGHCDGAWAFVQDAAREYGVVIPDRDLRSRLSETV